MAKKKIKKTSIKSQAEKQRSRRANNHTMRYVNKDDISTGSGSRFWQVQSKKIKTKSKLKSGKKKS